MKDLKGKLHTLVIAGCLGLSMQAVCLGDAPLFAASPGEPAVGEEPAAQNVPAPSTEAAQPAAPSQEITSPPRSTGGSDPSIASKQVRDSLLHPEFAYNPKNMQDPFKPFIAPSETTAPLPVVGDEDLETPPEPQRPMTPLQKMRISEIEAGLKAIMWGPMGRKAVIEDASGKGYIVSVGTPAGERNGVVTEIFNDHLVIQQEYWDKKNRRMIPQNTMVKLKKGK